MNDVQQLEQLIDVSKVSVKKADAVKRLLKNKDFKLIFIEDFFKEHLANTVMVKAQPANQTEKDQKYCDDQINAVGHTRYFLDMVLALGAQAANVIDQTEKELVTLRQEEDSE